MKALYYLEFAKSVNEDNQPIPAKELKWFIPDSYKIAYEDPEICNQTRLELQPNLDRYVIRVAQANIFKRLQIFFNKGCDLDSWAIVNG